MSISPPRVRGAGLARPPPHAPGLRIGLFGGSFDPPHEGHRLASLVALKRLRLDRVWWLVTPGNPLKETGGLPALELRLAAARALARHPRLVATGLEAAIGVRYTVDTIRWLKTRCPGVHFVWIMGADNLAGFHRWRRWRDIARLVPIVVVDRPGATLRLGPAGRWLAARRVPETALAALALAAPPAVAFLYGRRSPQSSTALRLKSRSGPENQPPAPTPARDD